MPGTDPIREYLLGCRELAEFCTQNGWIDNATLEYQVHTAAPGQLVVAVKFTEVIMKGAGCEGRRMPCFGHLRLRLDPAGRVAAGEAC